MQQADSFTDLKILNMDPWALGRHENLVIMLERYTDICAWSGLSLITLWSVTLYNCRLSFCDRITNSQFVSFH
uniref:Uncharacterized protein n=1 Tax=Setaria italica TaxID=4555 RepID=K3Y0L5_SETIT